VGKLVLNSAAVARERASGLPPPHSRPGRAVIAPAPGGRRSLTPDEQSWSSGGTQGLLSSAASVSLGLDGTPAAGGTSGASKSSLTAKDSRNPTPSKRGQIK
jgi:hypothetical protein